MGDRYELDLDCVYCGERNDVWYAPTCSSDTFTCGKCKKVNFVTSEHIAKKLEDINRDDVVDGFLSTTNSSFTDEEIDRMCKEHLDKLQSKNKDINMMIIDVPNYFEEKEKYYICTNCGELTTETEIMCSAEGGGMGLCWCEYCDMQWDEKYDSFQPVYFRYYREYIEIPKKVYDGLKGEKNTIIRLSMFQTVPDKVLKKL